MAGMADSVRYQFYETRDGRVLLMASERKFWRNFCAALGREDLYIGQLGAPVADHASGDLALRRELAANFRQRTSAHWVALGQEHDIPIGPVNSPAAISDDWQFAGRMPWQRGERLGAGLLSREKQKTGMPALC